MNETSSRIRPVPVWSSDQRNALISWVFWMGLISMVSVLMMATTRIHEVTGWRAQFVLLPVILGFYALLYFQSALPLRQAGGIVTRLGGTGAWPSPELAFAAHVFVGSLAIVLLLWARDAAATWWLVAAIVVEELVRRTHGPAIRRNGIVADRFIPWREIRAFEWGVYGDDLYLILHMAPTTDEPLPEVGILVSRPRQRSVDRFLSGQIV